MVPRHRLDSVNTSTELAGEKKRKKKVPYCVCDIVQNMVRPFGIIVLSCKLGLDITLGVDRAESWTLSRSIRSCFSKIYIYIKKKRVLYLSHPPLCMQPKLQALE